MKVELSDQVERSAGLTRLLNAIEEICSPSSVQVTLDARNNVLIEIFEENTRILYIRVKNGKLRGAGGLFRLGVLGELSHYIKAV